MSIKLLEDSFDFLGVPFLVQVKEREMFVNAEEGRVAGVNMHGAPAGRERVPRGWVICDCIVAKVRPDYPFSASHDFPENAERQHIVVETLEYPEKSRDILFKSWSAEPDTDRDDVDVNSLAESAIQKLINEVKSTTKVRELEVGI